MYTYLGLNVESGRIRRRRATYEFFSDRSKSRVPNRAVLTHSRVNPSHIAISRFKYSTYREGVKRLCTRFLRVWTGYAQKIAHTRVFLTQKARKVDPTTPRTTTSRAENLKNGFLNIVESFARLKSGP